jgi:hypothetical protein
MDRHPHAGIQQGLGHQERTMEYYSYVNIFEQKGVAYILLLSFLVLAVLLVRYISGSPGKDSSPEDQSD